MKDGVSVKVLEKKEQVATNKYFNFIKRNVQVLLILEKKILNSKNYEVSYELYRDGKNILSQTSIFPSSSNIPAMVLQHC